MNILDPNTPRSTFDDESLIREYYEELRFKKINLYPLMARRANSNGKLKEILFSIILDKEKRSERVVGRIMHSWLPAIFILKEGTTETKNQLKQILKKWEEREKIDFIDYVRSDNDSYQLIKTIVQGFDREKL